MWPHANSKCTSHDVPWEGETAYITIAGFLIVFGSVCSSIIFNTFRAFHTHFLRGAILKQKSKFFYRKTKRPSKSSKFLKSLKYIFITINIT